jgi:hypothetical protein
MEHSKSGGPEKEEAWSEESTMYEKGVRQQLDVCAIAKAVFGVNKTLLQAGRQEGRQERP